MRIAEIYSSLQGEGLLAGTPSTFVRASGCNLRCRWCDTPFASWEPIGENYSVASILAAVVACGPRHVVLTGGEPLLFPEVIPLCNELAREGFHITIETAGTVLPDLHMLTSPVDLMSISPKLSSSAPSANTPADWQARHEASRRRDTVLQALLASGLYQLKFVIESRPDLAEAIAWLNDLAATPRGTTAPFALIDRSRVFFMPQGVLPADLARTTQWLAAECRLAGIQLAPRYHIQWFGNTRGT